MKVPADYAKEAMRRACDSFNSILTSSNSTGSVGTWLASQNITNLKQKAAEG